MRALLCVLILGMTVADASAYESEALQDQLTDTRGGTTQVDLATQHFNTGVQLYREGKWRLAKFEFQASYDLSRSPDLLHNLSMVAEQQRSWDESLALERRFLTEKGETLNAEERQQCLTRIARLESQVVTPKAESKRRRPPAGSIALASVGAALLIVGVGTGGAALGFQNRLTSESFTQSEYEQLVGRGNALSACAISFDVVGGVMLAGGLSWLIVDRLRRP